MVPKPPLFCFVALALLFSYSDIVDSPFQSNAGTEGGFVGMKIDCAEESPASQSWVEGSSPSALTMLIHRTTASSIALLLHDARGYK
jgi:hypothetical protein